MKEDNIDFYSDWKRFKVRPSVVVAPSMFFSLDVGSELNLDGTSYVVTSKIVDQENDGKVVYRVSLEEIVMFRDGKNPIIEVPGGLTPTEQRDLNRKTPKGSGRKLDGSGLKQLATPIDKSWFYLGD